MALEAESALEAHGQHGEFGIADLNAQVIAPDQLNRVMTDTSMIAEFDDMTAAATPPSSAVDPQLVPGSQGHDSVHKGSRPKTSAKSAAADPDKPPRSTKHSSKNEGQHTDRRYLCYLCNKLFTRRRSVRDHISKIHNTKTWEPLRSLEIIVEPSTGEPVEPLEVTIARGPPPPPPEKPKKADKPKVREEAKVEEPEPEITQPSEAVLTVEEAEIRPASPVPSVTVANLKQESSVNGSRASSIEPSTVPAPVIGKKRPAPTETAKPLSAAAAAANKKGMAKIKHASTPNKKPKLMETERSHGTATPPFRSPSATPASTTQHKTPASKLKQQTSAVSATGPSSPTPSSSRAVSEVVGAASPSPSATGSSGSSNDDGEVFCICRKGDNHTWMIACDGGCDEWFHGNCVNIRERDGDLIDKYVCPNCERSGFQTTWKRMCRRKGCRKPALVFQDPPSKYCSKECGRMFFAELVRRGDPWIDTIKNGQLIVEGARAKKLRKKRKRAEGGGDPAVPTTGTKAVAMVNGDAGDGTNQDSRLATPTYSEEEKSEYETDSSLDDDLLPNRGDALRAGEVKAIIDQCKTIEQWRELGRKPATPPRDVDASPVSETKVEYDDFEKAKLASIAEEKQRFQRRNDVLNAREVFLGLVKNRSTSITDEVKKANPKAKDICGFDPRLAWSEEEFSHWYHNHGGKAVLESGNGKIGPPDDGQQESGGRMAKVANGAEDDDDDDEVESMPKKGGLCIKARCPRHRNWAKGQLAELRFEQDVVRRGLQRCEEEEREVRERAIVRSWEHRG